MTSIPQSVSAAKISSVSKAAEALINLSAGSDSAVLSRPDADQQSQEWDRVSHLFKNLATPLKGGDARVREETAESSAGRYHASISGLPEAAPSNPDSLGHLCDTCGYHLRGARGSRAHLHRRSCDRAARIHKKRRQKGGTAEVNTIHAALRRAANSVGGSIDAKSLHVIAHLVHECTVIERNLSTVAATWNDNHAGDVISRRNLWLQGQEADDWERGLCGPVRGGEDLPREVDGQSGVSEPADQEHVGEAYFSDAAEEEGVEPNPGSQVTAAVAGPIRQLSGGRNGEEEQREGESAVRVPEGGPRFHGAGEELFLHGEVDAHPFLGGLATSHAAAEWQSFEGERGLELPLRAEGHQLGADGGEGGENTFEEAQGGSPINSSGGQHW